MRRFDVDGNGNLDYSEFMKLLGFSPQTTTTQNSRLPSALSSSGSRPVSAGKKLRISHEI